MKEEIKMNNTPIDKDTFINQASDFFSEIFDPAFNGNYGSIEIRTFPKGQAPQQYFFESESEAAERAYQLFLQGIDVYFGVNPRIGNGGKKDNVQYLSAFHAEIDYGSTGHKKPCPQESYEEALNVIQAFNPEPTIIIHSGGGFHCYWVLSNPVKVRDAGIPTLESINKALSLELGGDPGTHNIDRVLRIPGTLNFKIPDNPRPVTLISNTHQRYHYEDFQDFIATDAADPKILKAPETKANIQSEPSMVCSVDMDQLPVSDRIKFLIQNGKDETYISRSEADMAVTSALINKGVSETDIKQIFMTQKIGEKYQNHPSPEAYLKHTIEEARKRSDLTEKEMIDPLFISGAVTKTNSKYSLKILNFEEYMIRKYKIIILDQERAMFRYNEKCYEQFSEKALNKLCQDELKRHRDLFGKSSLSELIHYAVGDTLVESERVKKDHLNYLTMQNGLYKIDDGILVDHTPQIFTTNLLPFDYDPYATCPRFMQFLGEIFQSDQDKINFVQEAVGYIFHKSIPTPAVFFLIGAGSNGKSVFINTISNLVGKENTSNVSFNLLSDETYILELYQKIVNISGETPRAKNIDTDVIKAVTAGDWVTGRELCKQPMKFRPFAKSFLAMNEPPSIKDTSHGMWRRIWVITFPKKFEEHEMDRQLEDKLSLELSGIFNWALEGYGRLKGKDFALKESGSMKLAKKDYRSSTDSVRAFIDAKLTRSTNPDDRLKYSDLYEQYLEYCQEEGEKNIQIKSAFRKGLEAMKYKLDYSKKDSNQLFVFNVKLKKTEETKEEK
jgi:putative DNA primase/helicase